MERNIPPTMSPNAATEAIKLLKESLTDRRSPWQRYQDALKEAGAESRKEAAETKRQRRMERNKKALVSK